MLNLLKVPGWQQAASADLRLAGGDWVDLGTGSGALAVGLAGLFPSSTVQLPSGCYAPQIVLVLLP